MCIMREIAFAKNGSRSFSPCAATNSDRVEVIITVIFDASEVGKNMKISAFITYPDGISREEYIYFIVPTADKHDLVIPVNTSFGKGTYQLINSIVYDSLSSNELCRMTLTYGCQSISIDVLPCSHPSVTMII